jgi:hypothetical protein
VQGTAAVSALVEASGIVASRKNIGALWTHNDAGDTARLFALGTDGRDLGSYDLMGAASVDWEDIALGPGPESGLSYLYVGDVGDNSSIRTGIQVYRVAEPAIDLLAPPSVVTVTGAEMLAFAYPDGAHNAETLLVDPTSGDLFLITKEANGVSGVYWAAAPHAAGVTRTLELATTVSFEGALSRDRLVTGGDVAPDGSLVILRSYTTAFVWRRAQGTPLSAAFAGEPCPVPLADEPQGEAIGFAADGASYYTLSEGFSPPLYQYLQAP